VVTDGTRIAFTSRRDGNPEVYVMNADGSDPTNVSNNPATDWMPAWSPDGAQLAFIAGRDGNFELYSMNADGTGQTRLTNKPASDFEPAWSPAARASASPRSRPATSRSSASTATEPTRST
jgi:Tol biopolymer transport system component